MRMVALIPINVLTPIDLMAGCTARNMDKTTVTSTNAEKKIAVLCQSRRSLRPERASANRPSITNIL